MSFIKGVVMKRVFVSLLVLVCASSQSNFHENNLVPNVVKIVKRDIAFVETPDNMFVCFGTFITHSYLLTTATCLLSKSQETLHIQYLNNGDIRLRAIESKINNIYIHPNYSDTLKTSDVALIETNINITSANVLELPAPETQLNYLDIVHTFAWELGSFSTQKPLRKVKNIYIPRNMCEKLINGVVHPEEICVQGEKIESNFWNLGSPLILPLRRVRTGEEFGVIMGLNNNPDKNYNNYNNISIYLDIRPYSDWIVSKLIMSKLRTE